MPRSTPEQRERAVGRLSAGDDPEAVAVAFNVHLSTVYRLQQRFVNTGSTADTQRSGRPRVTTQRQDRQILRHHLRNRFHTANDTARNTVGNHQGLISGQTVRRRLAERHLQHCRPARGPVLTQRHRMARQQWAQDHINWNWRQWRNILFTDESRFCISHVDGRVRVWRRRGERYAGDCVMEHNAQGGPNVMVWGGIGLNQSLGPVFFLTILVLVGETASQHSVIFTRSYSLMLWPFSRRAETVFCSKKTLARTQPGSPRPSCSTITSTSWPQPRSESH
ncbi:hypothetical protein V1264_017962 [Littorina saxatilis]|uniref:Transposase Tc1-like domain-containing protein n=1 Tax=Littorina saxatilis TaxID=31220 RepID=A0AAN9GFZ2_9CAEN